MKNSNDWVFWAKISLLIFSIILILIGFSLGYIYSNYEESTCKENPFAYSYEIASKFQKDVACSCSYLSTGFRFSFNESGVILDS